MTSALIALNRYSRDSDGPTVEVDDALRSSAVRGPTESSAARSGAELLPKSVCVSIVQRSPTGSPAFEGGLIRAPLPPRLARAAGVFFFLAGWEYLTGRSVPPVNERPSRSGEPSWIQ